MKCIAWFEANAAAADTKTGQAASGSITVQQNATTLNGVTFTPEKTAETIPTGGVLITNDSGQTKYYVGNELSNPIDAGVNGYMSVTFKVTASLTSFRTKGTGESDAEYSSAKAKALKESLASLAADDNAYIGVTAGNCARVSTANDTTVYSNKKANTVWIKLALENDGSKSEWTNLQFYASIKANETKEIYADAKDSYASTLTAKVGSVSGDPATFTAFTAA